MGMQDRLLYIAIMVFPCCCIILEDSCILQLSCTTTMCDVSDLDFSLSALLVHTCGSIHVAERVSDKPR